MHFNQLKVVLVVLIASFFPLMASATDSTQQSTSPTTTPQQPSTPASTQPSEPAAIQPTSAPNTTTNDASKQPSGTTMDSNQAESFQAICLSSWVKRVGNVGNAAAYKKFGEKYCACALTQPLDTDAAVDKAIQVCMSRTLLRNTMDSLEAEIGLEKASDKDVSQFCMDTWNLIYPKMNDQAKQTASSFCDCSQPKLVALLKNASSMIDKEYYAQIDTVAASCTGPLQANQAPAGEEPTKQ